MADFRRKIPCILSLVIGGLGFAAAPSAHADPGLERERQLAERLVRDVRIGDPEWLRANGEEFFALFTPSFQYPARGGVILVHAMGNHPDWPDVISPLRTRLPDAGYSTLSLQMPLLGARDPVDGYGATLPHAVKRIAAGVQFLKQREQTPVVVIGHGFGAASAAAYLAGPGDAAALVAIGILAREFLEPKLDVLALLEAIRVPVLDLYGAADFPEVLRRADARRVAARKAGNREYTQITVDLADHFFTGRNDELLELVIGWLGVTLGRPAAVADEVARRENAANTGPSGE